MRDLRSFLAGLDHAFELSDAERAEVGKRLEELVSEATRKRPDIVFERDALLAYLGTKVSSAASYESLVRNIDGLAGADLLLAHACAAGSSAAIREFENSFFAVIAPALRRLGLGAYEDEVTQRVREQLFISKDNTLPRIATLAGNGDLGALVRVIATRTGLNLRRRDGRLDPDGDEQIARAISQQECPGMETIKAEQRAVFKAAFETALENLDHQSRSVLRLHLLHRLNISQIAELFDVHRATTARWLGQIREELGRQTRQALRRELALDGSELDSLVKAAQSKIEISFDRLLETSAGRT